MDGQFLHIQILLLPSATQAEGINDGRLANPLCDVCANRKNKKGNF